MPLFMRTAKTKSIDRLPEIERNWYRSYAGDILSGRFVWEQLGIALQPILAGLSGIAGVLWLGWSAEQEFALIVVALWVAIGRNLVKLKFMYKGFQHFVRNVEATGGASNVWYMVARIRHPQTTAQQAGISTPGVYRPRLYTCLDCLMGGIGTFLIFVVAFEGDINFQVSEVTSRGFMSALAGFLTYELILTSCQVYDFCQHSDDRYVSMYPGFCGAGLFVLVFVALMTNDPEGISPRWSSFVINVCLVAWGCGKILWVIITWRKTVWLTDYLNRN